MNRVGFILKPDKSEAGAILDDLVPWLVGQGHQAIVAAEDDVVCKGADVVPEADFGNSIDLAVVLGGDGTMLRASHLVADAGIPVLGINLGRLGFLTGFDRSEAKEAVRRAMDGSLPASERVRIAVTYRPSGGEPVLRTALNDAVVHQGAMARLIDVEARLDGHLITYYRADGLIVATPTGSTAYNLAAGGPIVMPGQATMTLTPICAHALTHRPLVVPEDATLSLRTGEDSHGVVLTVDGQWAHSVEPGDEIEIAAAARPLLLFEPGKRYFDILREKLHWGRRSDNED